METKTQNENTALNKYVVLYVVTIAMLIVAFCQTANAQNWQWGKHYGGAFNGSGNSTITDAKANVYVTGNINSSSNLDDIFIAKYDSSGNLLMQIQTGGSFNESAIGIALDTAGNIVITGNTTSTDFPVTAGSYSNLFSGDVDMFVMKFDPNLNVLWSTYFGGISIDEGNGIATDSTGNVIITGRTKSTNFPLLDAGTFFQASLMGSSDIYIVKFDPNGTLLWSTFYGGSGDDVGGDVATDFMGNVIITGATTSTDFPTSGAAFQSALGGNRDAVVAKFDALGNRLWATYCGGANDEFGTSIAVKSNGSVVFAGSTLSLDFPVTLNAPESSYILSWPTQFLTQFDINGILVSSTYCNIGDNFSWYPNITHANITTDFNNNVFITGVLDTAIIVRKYDSQIGNILWTLGHYTKNTYFSAVSGISTDGLGNVYITGGATAGSTDPVVYGNDTLRNHGVFTAKIASYLPLPTLVWPGDANNDLIADVYDILPIGIGYNSTGPVRPGATINWIGQSAPDWVTTLSNGKDYKHVDCDGNGLIDLYDGLAILQNYGLTHVQKLAKQEYVAGLPDLTFNFPVDTVLTSTTIQVPIILGSSANQANDIYGIAFSISYDPKTVDTTKISLSLNGSWLGTDGNDLMYITKNHGTMGRLDVGITRIDHQNVSGFGTVGTLNIGMRDDIIMKVSGPIFKTLTLEAMQINAISNNETPVSINAGLDTIVVKELSPAGINNYSTNNSVKVYPNPTSGSFTISLATTDVQEMQLVNIIGEVVWQQNNGIGSKVVVDTQTLTAGTYYLSIITNDTKIMKQVNVIK